MSDTCPTMRVRIIGSDIVCLINADKFDPKRHEDPDAKAKAAVPPPSKDEIQAAKALEEALKEDPVDDPKPKRTYKKRTAKK